MNVTSKIVPLKIIFSEGFIAFESYKQVWLNTKGKVYVNFTIFKQNTLFIKNSFKQFYTGKNKYVTSNQPYVYESLFKEINNNI